MLNEETGTDPTPKEKVTVSRQVSVEEKPPAEDEKKQQQIKKKERDRLSRIHMRRGVGIRTSGETEKLDLKQQKEVLRRVNQDQPHDEMGKHTRSRRKYKVEVDRNKKSTVKTAFGTTYRPEPGQEMMRPVSSTDRGRNRRNKSSASDDEQESLAHFRNRSSRVKMNMSRNKLTDMMDECNKEGARGRSPSPSVKRARSPYHAASQMRMSSSGGKVRVEGDSKSDEKECKELNFFEKIQQNVRSYFSPRISEVTKAMEMEKKKTAHEGESPEKREIILIWIKRGVKEDMRGEGNFFISNERKAIWEKGNGKSSTENGSGPGGEQVTYSYGEAFSPNTEYQCKKYYYRESRNECTEKPRIGSFHRSKTFQKNMAPSPCKSSSSIGLILEPDEQVQNFTSANGMVSAIAKIEKLHQEIRNPVKSRSLNRVRGATLQEENLKPIVNCLPGEMMLDWMKVYTPSGCCPPRPKRFNSNSNSIKPKMRSCKSTSDLLENVPCVRRRAQRENFIHPVTIAEEVYERKVCKTRAKPESVSIVPIKRQWIVYSVTVAHSGQTRREDNSKAGTQPVESNNESDDREVKTSSKPETEKITQTSSVTLKEIINLSNRVFDESRGSSSSRVDGTLRTESSRESKPTLSFYLEKLMEEKKNYLNLQKTKNFRKTQKANFIADSFNFFNLLNKEFLKMKSLDPTIEQLRNVIAEKKEQKMEQYLDMYKKVIQSSLTEPEKDLMDKAKLELERYTDMYYDLMRCICLEKEADGCTKKRLQSGKSIKIAGDEKINFYEILKPETRRTIKSGSSIEAIKPRIDKSYFVTQNEERKNRDQAKQVRSVSKKRRGHSETLDIDVKSVKAKDIVAQSSTDRTNQPKEEDKKEEREPSERRESFQNEMMESPEKMLLKISLQNDGLVIKQAMDNTANTPAAEAMEVKCSTSDMSPAPSDVEKKLYKNPFQSESEATVYPKSSIDEGESSENPVEHSILKFKAFRKLLSEGLKYLTSPNDSATEQGHNCPKITNVDKVSETEESSICPSSTEKESKQSAEEQPAKKKAVRSKRDAEIISGVSQEERGKRPLQRRKSNPYYRSVSPPKTKKKEFGGKDPWWRAGGGINGKASTTNKPVKVKAEEKGPSKNSSVMTRNESHLRSSSQITNPSKNAVEVEECPRSVSRPESCSYLSDLPHAYFEWQFGLKHIKDILYENPSKLVNTRGLVEGKVISSADEEERELRKMDLSGGDENSIGSWDKGSSSPSQQTKEEVDPGATFKPEWNNLMDASFHKDPEKVAAVLNQFMGNISEAWKAAICLKDLIQTQISEESKSEEPTPSEDNKSDNQEQTFRPETQTIYAFRNFVKVVTMVFEDEENEEIVRKELFLLMKEVLRYSSETMPMAEAVLDILPGGDNRSRFSEEVAAMPKEVNVILAKELIANEDSFSKTQEDYDPSHFVAAVKTVGEKLEQMCLVGVTNDPIKEEPMNEEPVEEERVEDETVEEEQMKEEHVEEETAEEEHVEQELEEEELMVEGSKEEETVCETKKIYYLPAKRPSLEEPLVLKSNLEMLAEKINNICHHDNGVEICMNKGASLSQHSSTYFEVMEMDVKQKASVCQQSSVYYDTADGNQRNKVRVCQKASLYYDAVEANHTKNSNLRQQSSIYYDAADGNLKQLIGQKSSVYYDAAEGNWMKVVNLGQQSSIYYDAVDTESKKKRVDFHDTAEPVVLTSADESYFSLSPRTFAKYRDMIYDKIIKFLTSDNQQNINYGMALLRRMMDKDSNSSRGKTEGSKDEKEKKWNGLLGKLMDMCQAFEVEVREQLLMSVDEDSEKGNEILRICDHLKKYVEKIKSLVQEIRSPKKKDGESSERVQALEHSRNTNMERQLIAAPDQSLVKQSHLFDNAMDLINSIGSSFPKTLLPKWFSTSPDTESEESCTKTSMELLLENNKTIVKSLRKNIEKRQRKIKEIIDIAAKEGRTIEGSPSNEKLMRKIKDLKKCYVLLEKMICDPTFLPPKWLKLDEMEKPCMGLKEQRTSIMEMLEDIVERAKGKTFPPVAPEQTRRTPSTISLGIKRGDLHSNQEDASIGSLTLFNINYAKLNIECPSQLEADENQKKFYGKEKNGVPRPQTA